MLNDGNSSHSHRTTCPILIVNQPYTYPRGSGFDSHHHSSGSGNLSHSQDSHTQTHAQSQTPVKQNPTADDYNRLFGLRHRALS